MKEYLAYATTSGPDCLKDVISRYEVYQAIKGALTADLEVFIIFRVENQNKEKRILNWTLPWTLPSNWYIWTS